MATTIIIQGGADWILTPEVDAALLCTQLLNLPLLVPSREEAAFELQVIAHHDVARLAAFLLRKHRYFFLDKCYQA